MCILGFEVVVQVDSETKITGFWKMFHGENLKSRLGLERKHKEETQLFLKENMIALSCLPKGQKEHQQTEVAVGKFWLTLRKNLLDKSSAAKAQGLPSHQW